MRLMLPLMLLGCGPKVALEVGVPDQPLAPLAETSGCALFQRGHPAAEIHLHAESPREVGVMIFAEPGNDFFEVVLLADDLEYESHEPFPWHPRSGKRLSAAIDTVVTSSLTEESRRVKLDFSVGHCDRR